jgi:hypothetical protein
MDVFRRQKFNEAMLSKNRTLAIRVGRYQSSDIKEANFDYGYIKGDTYKPGGTCAGSGKITFTSIITTFNKLDKIYPEIGLLVDGTYEWVKMGEYFINDIEIDRNRNTTTLDLMDGMFKLNREHVTDLTYPAEIRHVIKEICLKTGIKLANENMGIASMNYRIESIPKEKKMTFRDVLSLATQMLGMSCFFNREGKLEVKELTDSGIVITADSYFMHGLTKSEIEYQIAGITCKKDKETLTVGLRTGRSLELDNLFMSQVVLDNLYHNIKDIRYYPFNLNYQGHLLLDVGQWVTIKTNKNETFKAPVLSQSFAFKGGLRSRISADSKAGNDAQYSYAGTITKKIEQFNEFEAQIQNQIEEADKGFDQKVNKVKKDFSDQVELAKARAEQVKQELSDTIDRRFRNFDTSVIDEAKRKATEALNKVGANASLAQEAKRISEQAKSELNNFKASAERSQAKLTEDIESFKSQYGSKLNDVKRTADGLFVQMGKVESYIGADGQRQEALKKYARDESTSQISAFRQVISSDYVAKSIYEEDVRGISQRIGAVKTETNKEITSQLASYRQSVDGKFTDISSQITTYKKSADGQIVNLANQVTTNKSNADNRFSTLSGQILSYKASADSQIANVADQLSRKVEVTDFQKVKETSRLYERIIGTTEDGIADKVARMALTNQLFQVEVGKHANAGGPNMLRNSRADDGLKYWTEADGRLGFTAHPFYFNGQKRMFELRPGAVVKSPRFIVKRNADYIFNILVFDNNSKYFRVYFCKRKKGSNAEFEEKQLVFDGRPRWTNGPVFSNEKTVKKSFKLNTEDYDEGYLQFEYDRSNPDKWGGLFMTELDFYEGTTDRLWQPAPEDATFDVDKAVEATRTQMTQLAGSWAVQNLTSAGSIVSQINATNNQILIEAEKIRLKGKTLLDELTAIDGYFKRLFVGDARIGKLNTDIIESDSITADKVIMDSAMAKKIVSSDVFTDQLFAKRAFINRIQSVAIDASQVRSGILSGDRIYGGTIRGANIFGGTLTGHTKIQLGSYGSFDTVNGGLQIHVPRDYNAKDGLGVQFIGSYGRGENVPYGLFIYKDSDFTKGNTATISDDFLLTVEGYISAKGIGWLRTGRVSIHGKTAATIGLWNSDNVSLSFGGPGNDIYYSYNGTAYSLWDVIKKDSSDRRLKENIIDCNHKALDYIRQFKFKEYDWKKQEDRPQQAHTKIGLIAQEVQAVDPTLVYENGDTLNLDNLRLTNIALKAIQELALENQKLTHRLENLENERTNKQSND